MSGDTQTILIVEDSDEVRELFMLVLETAGYRVEGAASAEAAFEKVKAERPALLVLDVMLPGMDGLELLLKIRSDLRPPIPPVIMCSGFDLAEEEALRRGAARFLRKPVSPALLVGAVALVLSGCALEPEKLAHERQQADLARRRARQSARDLVRRIEAAAAPGYPTLEEIADEQLSTLAEYLAIGSGAIAILHEDQLRVVAASQGSPLAVGADLGHRVPEAYQVLETGSALVLSDASARPFASVSEALGGIRFFVGVPLMAGDVPIGVVCFFKQQPYRLEGEDLATIQLFCRHGSELMSLLAAARPPEELPGRFGGGIALPSLFEHMLNTELRLLARHGGSIELAVVRAGALDQVREAIRRSEHRERMIAGALSSGRAAIYKRSRDGSARGALSTVLAALLPRDVSAIGVVDLAGGGLDALSAASLIQIADRALDRALEARDGVRRVLIEELVSPRA